MRKIIIAGGSGFMGKHLTHHFLENGDKVVILTRGLNASTKKNLTYQKWDGRTLGKWTVEIENADILINLTGKSVDCRYSEKNKSQILNSRIDSTNILHKAVAKCDNPPKIWINASTATIYKHSLDKQMTEENGEIGSDFSMGVAKAWEEAFFQKKTLHTRQVTLRTSLVLGKEGGVMTPLIKLANLGFGGKQGNGKQKFAWIHMIDVIRIIEFVCANKQLEGPINCTAPETITNARFMKSLRQTLGKKWGLPQPRILLYIGAWLIRTEPELVLKSRWVYPQKLLDCGFDFQFNIVSEALKEINSTE